MSDPGTEIATEAAKAAALEIVKPVTGIVADVLGGLIGDRIRNWRTSKPAWQEKNQAEIAERAARKLQDRGVKKAAESANPVFVEEILEAAKNTTAEELKELYSGLVAAAMDPAHIADYRREFVGIVNKLEPLDARVLPLLDTEEDLLPSRGERVMEQCKASRGQIVLAMANLTNMGLIEAGDEGFSFNSRVRPRPTTLGRQFLACVR